MESSPVPSQSGSHWQFFGTKYPRSELVYFTQIIVLSVIIVTSIVNLSIPNSKNDQLWLSMLCSAVGYILPSPHISTPKIQQI